MTKPTLQSVSIHAPTRSATPATPSKPWRQPFQSTRPRGARPQPELCVLITAGFNPRAHAERDGLGRCRLLICTVSIHAPTRSATSTPPVANAFMKFQSTRPRGARPNWVLFSRFFYGFNPRAHAERDIHHVRVLAIKPVSIHAPTRSATLYC